MAIATSRVKGKGEIQINEDLCTGCAECVEVCKDFSLTIKDNKASVSDNPLFGCIACGHCMAVCPADAIHVSGRMISRDDLFELPHADEAASYEQLTNLFLRRRSIREFLDKPVEPGKIEKILDAAMTSPMGIPPSDVNVLILNSKEKNRLFIKDFCNYLNSIRWMVSGWFLTLMRPVWGKTNADLFQSFVKPLFEIYISSMNKGINSVTYDAPLVMYFYGSPYCDPADPVVAATTAMYAGQSLGLGTCMLGGIHPLIQYGSGARKFREKYGIKYTSREGLFVIFGYPDADYKKGIRRSFASTTFLQ